MSESVAWLGPLAAPIERLLRSMVSPPLREETGLGGG
jgi:hypothetical protein